MDRRKATWIIGGAIAIALVAIIALVVTKLSGKNSETPKKDPTPTIMPEVPDGSVLVWRLSEVREQQKDERGTMKWSKTYSYDELGRWTECISYTDGKEAGKKSCTYDAATHQTKITNEYPDDIDDYRKDEITYDAKGRPLQERYYVLSESLDDDKWTLNLAEEHSYGTMAPGVEYEDDYSAIYSRYGDAQQESRSYYIPEERRYVYQNRSGESDPWSTSREIWYDEFGRELAEYEIISDLYETRTSLLVWEKLYNDDGSSRKFWYNNSDRSLGTITECDADGRTLKASNYDSDGQSLGYRIWTYTSDQNGRSEKVEKYNPDGTLEYWSLEEFDKDDVLLKRTTYYEEEKRESVSYLREVNDLGQTVRESRNELEVTEYTYDENGNRNHAVFKRSDCTITWDYVYIPVVLTEAQAAEAETYYVEEYKFP